MSNKVLITGGAGFIGSNYVAYALENTTDEIFVLDKLTYAGDLKNLQPATRACKRIILSKGDICDVYTWYLSYLKNMSLIVWCTLLQSLMLTILSRIQERLLLQT